MAMKSEYVNPFVEGTISTYETMCDCKPIRHKKLTLVDSETTNSNGLMAIIGLSGDCRGAVIMTMPKDLGTIIVEKFIGTEPENVEELTDGFGELINIIAGVAAAKLPGNVNLALPTVLIGKENKLPATKLRPWVIIPMKFPELGEFELMISLEDKK